MFDLETQQQEASDAQRLCEEFYSGVNIGDHPADLCEFESGDSVVDAAHAFLMSG